MAVLGVKSRRSEATARLAECTLSGSVPTWSARMWSRAMQSSLSRAVPTVGTEGRGMRNPDVLHSS